MKLLKQKKTLIALALACIAVFIVYAQNSSTPPQPGWFPTVSTSGVTVWTQDGGSLTNLNVSASPASNFTSILLVSSNSYSTNVITTNLYATTIITSNIYTTNLNVSVISNITDITINTNVVFTQNISVSGKATLNNITVTNQLLFLTNAFPLSAGSTWNLTKNYQFIITNNDFSITAISGLTNHTINWGVLKISNSAAAVHFCDLSSLPVTVIGTSSTNKLYVPAGKVGIVSVSIWGNVGDSTNLVTALGQ